MGRGLVNEEIRGGSASQICKSIPCESTLSPLRVPDGPSEFGNTAGCDTVSPITAQALPLRDCECRSYELSALDTIVVPVQLAGASGFSQCRLRLSSDRPVELQLVETALQDSHIELNGPITLKMRDVQLTRVSIVARSSAAGAPSLTLDNTNADVFTLHAGEGQRISDLDATFSTFVAALLEADSMHLASVFVQRSALTARKLETSDVRFIESSLAIERGLLSASDFNEVSMPSCGQVRFVESKIATSEVSCNELLQLYSTNSESSVLEGTIELDQAEISNTVFGLNRPTLVLSYGSIFSAMTFCEQTQAVRLSRGSASCAACQGPLASGEGLLCSDGTFSADSEENPCAAFEGVPMCDLPPSMRPH